MCHFLFSAIVKLEQHRISNVKSGELVQCARRHYDLATMVDILSFGTRKHRHGVAAIVFIEATSCGTWARHAGI